MSLPAAISPAVLTTLVGHLTPHFLPATNGDAQSARQAATDMLAAYNTETEAELAVAAEIVSLAFHALEALGQAASPDMPLNKVLRLRGSAVSLSRESHKARRRLDQLQRARLTAAPIAVPATTQPPANPTPPAEPTNEPAPGRTSLSPTPARDNGAKSLQTWTAAQQQRHAAQRMTENLKRNQAEHARREAAKMAAARTENNNQAAM